MRNSYSPISNATHSTPIRQTIGLSPNQTPIQRVETIPYTSPRYLRQSSPAIIRESVNPTFVRQSVLNQHPDDTANYRIVSEKVYKLPPQQPQPQPQPQLIAIPNNDEQLRRLRDENARLNEILRERNFQKQALENQVQNLKTGINEYEKRIHVLANELDNLSREYDKNVQEFQQSKEIFEKNISVLRDSYLHERNNLVKENNELRDMLNKSRLQNTFDSPQRNRLQQELNDLQTKYDDLLSKVEKDLKNLSHDDELMRKLTELKRENEELKRRSPQKSISFADDSEALKKENINLSQQLFKQDQIIKDLEDENRRLFSAIQNQSEQGHWC